MCAKSRQRQCLRRLLAEAPTALQLLVSAGAVAYRRGRYEEAAAHFARVVELAPRELAGHVNLTTSDAQTASGQQGPCRQRQTTRSGRSRVHNNGS